MDGKKINAVKEYFEDKKTKFLTDAVFLSSDSRLDEAVFAKIQMNVYDIFNTLFSVAIKSCESNPDEVRDYFLRKTEEIPAKWLISLRRAEQYGDMKKVHIEQIKLDTAERIRNEFRELWEASYD